MPIQARTEFAAALNQIASEKGVDVDVIISAIQDAALAAYRKDLTLRNEPIPDDFDSFTAKIDPSSGEIMILSGEENITPPGFARIAAQTAKQVISQRLHEAEKGAIMEEYEAKVGTIISGSIQRQEGNTYFIDLGRAEGVMPPSEQTRGEYYGLNQRMKFFIKEIRETGRGPEVIVSRADSGLVKGLFALEVPEIQGGTVEIKELAREAGGRTKIAAISKQDGVDPVGSLVGQKGVRVQAVINELGEEKIDIIAYSEDPARFIAAALSPAKDVQVYLNEDEKTATVKVSDSQLSLAIGKGGQNVRLAAKLTGWKIDIEGSGEVKDAQQAEIDQSGQAPIDDSGNPQPAATDDQGTAVVATVAGEEKAVDEAIEAESVDGATQPEPTPVKVEQAPALDEETKAKVEEEIEQEAGKAANQAENAAEAKEAKEAADTLVEAVKTENPEAENEQVDQAIGDLPQPDDQADKKTEE